MSFLKKIKQENASNSDENKKSGFDVVGIVLELKEAQLIDGKFSVIGTVKNNNRQVKEGDEIHVSFRDKFNESCLANFTKGHGTKKALEQPDKVAGSLMCLEGCYLTDEKNNGLPVVNSRWLTTIASTMKGHNDRTVISDVYASAPVITFTNPNKQVGEPDRIKLPVNAQGDIFQAVKNEHGGNVSRKFSTEWAIDKLKLANDPVVTIETLSSARSSQVRSIDDLRNILADQLNSGSTSMAMIRLTDGEEVLTRKVYVSFKKEGDNYMPDIESTLNNLFSRDLFHRYKNSDVFAGVESGDVKIESVPGYRFRYSGNATQDDNVSFKTVQNIIDGKSYTYQAMFGTDPSNMAKIILPGIIREPKDGRQVGFQDFSPTNVVIEESGIFSPKTFPTPMINKRFEATPAMPIVEEPEEPEVPEPSFDDEQPSVSPKP